MLDVKGIGRVLKNQLAGVSFSFRRGFFFFIVLDLHHLASLSTAVMAKAWVDEEE